MKILWTSDCKTDPEKEKRKRDLDRAKKGFRTLRGIVQQKLDGAEKSRLEPDYDSPAWAYRQAALNDRIRTLKEVLDILDDVC